MFNDLLIGGTAAAVARTLTAPLELYKIQCQNRYLPDATLSKVLRREGFRYMWKGNGMNCLRAFPQFGINYATFKFSHEHLFSSIGSEPARNFCSGGIAGLVAMSLIYPLETIRTRLSLQLAHSHYRDPWHVFKSLTYPELYSGLRISLLGFIPFSALNYTFYFQYRTFLGQQKLNDRLGEIFSGWFIWAVGHLYHVSFRSSPAKIPDAGFQ